MGSISEAINEFGLSIFKELNSTSNATNIFFSPMSISAALCMVLLGANGSTASQIEKVPVAEVHSQFQALLSKLTSLTNQAELKIANGMFGQKKFNFEDQYLSSAQLLYQAKLESVDFENAAEETRQKINEWVESQTQGKIKDMFSKDSIDAATSLILVNAIYFKGKWNKQFREEKTKEAPFYVNKLPYGEGDLSMFILLTDEDGLEKIEQKVSSKSLAEWTNSKHLRKTKVNIYLPRFKIEESYNLGPHLINMGIIDAFSQQKANLSGISEVGLYVSQVMHKAFVEVNEEGTEAAAATGVVITPKMLVIPQEFNANHPFIFFIQHNKTNTILFYGKFYSP
ncbi:hypothetical protein FKM82_006489 [Ascaphus truei]